MDEHGIRLTWHNQLAQATTAMLAHECDHEHGTRNRDGHMTEPQPHGISCQHPFGTFELCASAAKTAATLPVRASHW